MQRAGIIGGLFLGLCLAIYLLTHVAQGSDSEEAKGGNEALEEIEAIMNLAENAENAIEQANYGEASTHLTAVKERLNKLVFVIAEQQINASAQ